MRGKGRLARWIHGEGGDLWLSNIAKVAMMAVGFVAATMTLLAMITVLAVVTVIGALGDGTGSRLPY